MTITETLIKNILDDIENYIRVQSDDQYTLEESERAHLSYDLSQAFERVAEAAYEAGKKSQTAFIYEIRKERLRKGICASCKSPVSLENKRLCKYHRNKFLEYKKNYNLQKRLEKLLHPQEKKK